MNGRALAVPREGAGHDAGRGGGGACRRACGDAHSPTARADPLRPASAEGPCQIDESDIQALRAVGLHDLAIVEALAAAMFSAFTNTLADTLKLDQDLEAMGLSGEYF